MQAILAVTAAIAGTLALTPLALRTARGFNLLSRPDGNRKLHSRPTPLLGGAALYLGLLLGIGATCAILAADGRTCVFSSALGLSAGMLCLLGFCDDLFDINARWKLIGQILATLPVVAAGCCVERLALFGHVFEIGWLGVFWTIGWLVLGINALNLLDGMDGLATLVGLFISAAIAVLAAVQGLQEVMLMALVLAGALAGFLVYNLPPARIYLGDCGSLVIGFVLSLLALQVSQPAAGTANVAVLVALLFVPLLDTTLAIARRTLKGQSFMAADRSHVHHRLLDRGLGIWKVLGLLGLVCLICWGVAWSILAWGHESWAWVALAAIAVALMNRQLAGHEEWGLAKMLSIQLVLRIMPRRPAPHEPNWLGSTMATLVEIPSQNPPGGEIGRGGRRPAEIGPTGRSSKVAA